MKTTKRDRKPDKTRRGGDKAKKEQADRYFHVIIGRAGYIYRSCRRRPDGVVGELVGYVKRCPTGVLVHYSYD